MVNLLICWLGVIWLIWRLQTIIPIFRRLDIINYKQKRNHLNPVREHQESSQGLLPSEQSVHPASSILPAGRLLPKSDLKDLICMNHHVNLSTAHQHFVLTQNFWAPSWSEIGLILLKIQGLFGRSKFRCHPILFHTLLDDFFQMLLKAFILNVRNQTSYVNSTICPMQMVKLLNTIFN